MVFLDNIDAVSPSVTFLQSNLAPKKYVVVKNHVREISICDDNTQMEKSDNSKEVTEEKVKTRKRKSKSLVENQPLQYTDDNDQNSVACEISQSDLEELRQVYIQCKNVINKIETKYGHLLNSDNHEECKCIQNKKVIFKEDGQPVVKDSGFEKHICLHKLKPMERTGLQIEYNSDYSSDLPDSLKELGNLLKEPIDFRLRRIVINKIKYLKHEFMNELRNSKHLLIKKLKENPPEDLLCFEGTNLSTLLGYPA